jgi:hypothetical protein
MIGRLQNLFGNMVADESGTACDYYFHFALQFGM